MIDRAAPADRDAAMIPTDRRTPRRVLAAAVLLVVTLAVVGSAVSSSPAVCALCHAKQARSLSTTAHRGSVCYDCHLPSGAWSWFEAKTHEAFSMYPAAAAGRGVGGSGVRISRAACSGCHRKVLAEKVAAGGLRVVHSECAAGPEKCDGCHSDVAHPGTERWVRRSDMSECLTCHADRQATLRCESCHTATVGVAKPRTGTFKIAHGPKWESTHGMMDARACAACHEPSSCVPCHGTRLPHPDSFVLRHGQEALRPGAACRTCHDDPAICDSCHGVPMPHPADFREVHSKVATSPADARCLKCHTGFDCRNCHDRHQHPRTTRGTLGSSRLPTAGGAR
jgi:hypothetical protein